MSEACNIPRWELLKQQLNNLTPTEFREAMEKWPQAILIDCRTVGEYEHSHLKNAVNLDYLDYAFLEKMEALDREQTYLVYCRTGRRSVRTCTLMSNSGFGRLYNLDGGLVAMQEEMGDTGFGEVMHYF